MKIAAGLGSIDDYIPFVKAGVDELFCGYIPDWWMKTYGIYAPLNRREVLYYNVQIGSKSELEILRDMMDQYHVPVSIALNALYYTPEQYLLLQRYIEECISIDFNSFIIADYALLIYLKQTGLLSRIQVTISGEFSEMNEYLMDELLDFGVRRIIFHRKMTPAEMKACTCGRNCEFEAFALNEKCHFHGAFCNSLHCDELAHICQVPYQLGPCNELSLSGIQASTETDIGVSDCSNYYIPGSTGCGLCALWDLRESGITHLKLVGRGNCSDDMGKDIRALANALAILESVSGHDEYIQKMNHLIL